MPEVSTSTFPSMRFDGSVSTMAVIKPRAPLAPWSIRQCRRPNTRRGKKLRSSLIATIVALSTQEVWSLPRLDRGGAYRCHLSRPDRSASADDVSYRVRRPCRRYALCYFRAPRRGRVLLRRSAGTACRGPSGLPPSLERSQRSARSARQTPPLATLSHWPSSRPTRWSSSCHRSFFCSAVALRQTKSLLLDCL
jgi:hypothetical protein